MGTMTFEESVKHMLGQPEPEASAFIKYNYFDPDGVSSGKRYASSEEFIAIKGLLKLDSQVESLRVLDLGCGHGIASFAFASLGNEVHSVDPDTSSLVGLGAVEQLAKTLESGSIETHQNFAEALPFPDDYFDIIFTRQALHHYQDLGKALNETARVLKTKGLYMASREHIVDDDEQLTIFLENHPLQPLHGCEYAYSLEAYREAIENAPLNIEKCLFAFDSVINHFPMSNEEFRKEMEAAMQKKLGGVAASMWMKSKFLENIYRKRRSSFCNYPGRLYSFLCKKA